MKKKIKRILSAVLIVGIVVNMSATTVLASPVSESYEKNRELAKNYISELAINEEEILQMVNDEGFSYSDAVYYYTIDKMVDYLVDNELSFNVSDVYTDEEIAADYNGFKEKILEFDVNAIAAALENAKELVENAPQEVERFRNYYGTEEHLKITVKNSDGSYIEYIDFNETVAEPYVGDSISDKKENVNMSARGMKSNTWKTDQFDNYGTFNGSSEVKLTAPLAYTKLLVETNTTYNSSGVKVNSVDCFTATYGAITVSNKGTSINNRSDKSTAEGIGDVVWTCNGSAGLDFSGVVSFSISAGASWTEQLIHKYYSSGKWTRTTKVYS